jgi:virulence factor Mce-like protein
MPTISLTGEPVLVGAVTVLVAVVAVFLAYHANQGLPFVPTTTLNVQLSSGANTVVGNDVRVGGYRVGFVQDMRPARLPNGRVGALMTIKLDKKAGPIPIDSSARIRARSTLGLKYVELTKGSSRRTFVNGATMPERQTRVPVELDQFFDIFDARTRRATQETLRGSGDALVGRGADLNRFVLAAPQLFRSLRSTAANLAAPRTQLPRLFAELDNAARAVIPVRRTLAHGFTQTATTFDALSRDPAALRDAVAKGPSTEDVAMASLRVQRPFLTHLASVSADLRGATAELRPALAPLDRALSAGIPVLPRTVGLSDRLAHVLLAVRDVARTPTTPGALRGLTATVGTLKPQLRYLGPFVTVCNYWTTFWTFVGEHFTAPDETGGTQRFLVNSASLAEDSLQQMGANEFVHGAATVPIVNGGRPQYLHGYGFGNNAIDPHGNANCAGGQTGYIASANRYTPDPKDYGRTAVNPARTLKNVLPRIGPTFAHYDRQGRGFGRNPDHVPPGETFSDAPGGIAVEPDGTKPQP